VESFDEILRILNKVLGFPRGISAIPTFPFYKILEFSMVDLGIKNFLHFLFEFIIDYNGRGMRIFSSGILVYFGIFQEGHVEYGMYLDTFREFHFKGNIVNPFGNWIGSNLTIV
jgi:hypothetical protein